MNVTRDVMNDLVTLYLAGEASADTRALVEEGMRLDPELARQVEAARQERFALPAAPPPGPSGEREALERTRNLLKSRSSTLAIALVFTALPLSFTFDGSRVTFLLIRDAPIIGLAWWLTAAVMWGAHFWVRRRLRVSGL
jgi:anti-sigma factor RsiW